MPELQPIQAIYFNEVESGDISTKIAPPYDVLDAESKGLLVSRDPHNICVIDLPHLPAKTLGPDPVYVEAGQRFRQWISENILKEIDEPELLIYSQLYEHNGQTFDRRGIISNVKVQDFGPAPSGKGGIYPHEQTFSEAKKDRLKLMEETGAQLSPIFGIYSDPDEAIVKLIKDVVDARDPDFTGKTDSDHVTHRIWRLKPNAAQPIIDAMAEMDVFIADGHHRYNTAINYRKQAGPGKADWCMFVLVAMQDPGMIVLPTHRVLGGMNEFSMSKLIEAASDLLAIEPFEGGDLQALEKALPAAGPHAMGLYDPSDKKLYLAKLKDADPLKATHGSQSEAWRQLDVAILQHAVVEGVLQPTFAQGEALKWKFPHELKVLKTMCDSGEYQLGVVMQPTPLESVTAVSEANELMPQKSTFFFPKLATGLAINPLK